MKSIKVTNSSSQINHAILGQGYNSAKCELTMEDHRIPKHRCKTTPINKGEVKLTEIKSSKEVLDSLGIGGSLQLKLALFPVGGGISGEFKKSQKSLNENIYYLYSFCYETSKKTILPGTLNFQGRKMDQQFLRSYGDSYVSGITYGGVLFVSIQRKKTEEEEKKILKGDLSASIKIADVIEATISGNINNENKKIINNLNLDIKITTIGGGPPTTTTDLSKVKEFVESFPKSIKGDCMIYMGVTNYSEHEIKSTELSRTRSKLLKIYETKFLKECLSWQKFSEREIQLKENFKEFLEYEGRPITIKVIQQLRKKTNDKLKKFRKLIKQYHLENTLGKFEYEFSKFSASFKEKEIPVYFKSICWEKKDIGMEIILEYELSEWDKFKQNPYLFTFLRKTFKINLFDANERLAKKNIQFNMEEKLNSFIIVINYEGDAQLDNGIIEIAYGNNMITKKSQKPKMKPKYILFVGNPGTGKSTMLNSLIGKAKFKSGVSFGQGMTFELQCEEIGGITYMDTPGLDDTDLKKQAGEAIEKALKKNGIYQIIFFCTLESGRVKPTDLATIDSVLNAINLEKLNFGIIINKVDAQEHKDILADNEEGYDIVKAKFRNLKFPPSSYQILERNSDLIGKSNNNRVLKPTPPYLIKILDKLDGNDINSVNISTIKIDDYKKLQKKMEAFLKDKKLLEQQIAEQKILFNKIQLENRKILDQQKKQMQLMRDQFLHRIKRMEINDLKSKKENLEKEFKERKCRWEKIESDNECGGIAMWTDSGRPCNDYFRTGCRCRRCLGSRSEVHRQALEKVEYELSAINREIRSLANQ